MAVAVERGLKLPEYLDKKVRALYNREGRHSLGGLIPQDTPFGRTVGRLREVGSGLWRLDALSLSSTGLVLSFHYDTLVPVEDQAEPRSCAQFCLSYEVVAGDDGSAAIVWNNPYRPTIMPVDQERVTVGSFEHDRQLALAGQLGSLAAAHLSQDAFAPHRIGQLSCIPTRHNLDPSLGSVLGRPPAFNLELTI